MVAFNESGQGYFTFEEVKEYPAVKDMLKKFRADQQEQAAKLFYLVFNRHAKSSDYTLQKLKKVQFVTKEQCFHVYFNDGNWFHYTLTGEWY